MFHRSEELMRIIKNELTNQGIAPSDDILERIRVCIDELKRRNIPPDRFRDIARIIAQVIAEKPYRQIPSSGLEGFLSMISSCRLIGYQLRRNESIYCPIMVPAGFTAISMIGVSSTPGNISLFIKRIGEPIDKNAYYAEDIILVGYFDTNTATWNQRLSPGLYLVEVHNYYNEDVNVSVDVVTCIISD
jgi:hypothetical protein